MASWTLEEARAKLTLWLDAEEKVAFGQGFTMGDKSYTRVDADKISTKIRFWRNEVDRLERLDAGKSPFQIVRTRFL